MNPLSIASVAVLLWLGIALVLDHFLLAAFCTVCANALALELKLRLPAAELTYPPVSLLVLIVLPMISLAIYLIPWRQLKSRSDWRDSVALWCQPWFWLFAAVLLTILGESLYLMFSEYLPKAVTALAEKVSITATVLVSVPGFKEHTPFSLTASLAGFIGLVIGACLFLNKGVREILE